MNKRQCMILTLGITAALLVPILATKHFNPPLVGRLLEDSPGLYSWTMTDAFIPKWAILASLSIIVLTITAINKTRTQNPP